MDENSGAHVAADVGSSWLFELVHQIDAGALAVRRPSLSSRTVSGHRVDLGRPAVRSLPLPSTSPRLKVSSCMSCTDPWTNPVPGAEWEWANGKRPDMIAVQGGDGTRAS